MNVRYFDKKMSDIQTAKSESHLSATGIVEALNHMRSKPAAQRTDRIERIGQSL